MKKYNKIIEAIDRGILLALDDYDDTPVSHKVGLYKEQISTKENVELMTLVVDLGLPSGTLWCKYNLGVDLNLLSNSWDWYGKYYAWGEIEPKMNYNKDTYKFYLNIFGDTYKLLKYANNRSVSVMDKLDNLLELLPTDDAAVQNIHFYNFKFHIPTRDLFEELIRYTSYLWKNQYNGIQDLNGMLLTGKNKLKLFLPACGYYNDEYLLDRKTNPKGYYWSSDLAVNNCPYAWCLSLSKLDIDTYDDERYYGYNIRPVINLD